MMKTLTVKPGLTGVDAQTVQIPLPQILTGYVGIIFDYTVEDTGITAGENIAGCVQHISAGEGADTPIYVESDELPDLVAMSWEGVSTGKYIDPTPTTAVASTSEFFIKGPFDFRKMDRPVLEVALKKITEEFGGATSFSGTVTIVVGEVDGGKPVYYKRIKTITATQHDIGFGTQAVEDVYLKSTAAITKLEMDGRTKSGEIKQLIKETDITPFERAYAMYKDSAKVSNTLLLPSLNSTYFPDRALHVEMASGSCLIFARCV